MMSPEETLVAALWGKVPKRIRQFIKRREVKSFVELRAARLLRVSLGNYSFDQFVHQFSLLRCRWAALRIIVIPHFFAERLIGLHCAFK